MLRLMWVWMVSGDWTLSRYGYGLGWWWLRERERVEEEEREHKDWLVLYYFIE